MTAYPPADTEFDLLAQAAVDAGLDPRSIVIGREGDDFYTVVALRPDAWHSVSLSTVLMAAVDPDSLRRMMEPLKW